MKAIYTLLHYSWCLPQTLLGLILRGCGHEDIISNANWPIMVEAPWLKNSYFSLGRYVFVSTDWYIYENTTILHEFGHSRQSLILGWLYLPVIALPSLLWHWWYYAGKPKKCSYYAFFTEKWANRLAGIEIE